MPLSTDALLRSPELYSLGSLRPGGTGDAIDGVIPRLVVKPTTVENVAAQLGFAARERLSVVLRGNGTKIGWGRTPAAIDLLIGTVGLDRVLAHRHGDMTATFESGARLRDVNAALARHGQHLPLDSAFELATIGGIVATNDAGPLRHRHGTPRDLLIGVTLALTDGRIVKAGGHVVKNVAGYDLGRLMSGSFGSLAAIVDATFKLLPLAPASTSLLLDPRTADGAARDVEALAAAQLEPVAFEVRATISARSAAACRILVRFASSPAATRAQVEQARQLVSGQSRLLEGGEEATLWREQTEAPWPQAGAIVRLSWFPARLADLLRLLEDVARASAASIELVGRAGVGAGFVRIDADAAAQAAAIERLRAAGDVAGNVVVLRASAALKGRIDVWPGMATADLLRSVKQALDPAGTLGADRGPI